MLDPTTELILTCEILIFICLNSIWLTLYLSMRKRQFKKGNYEEPVSIIIPTFNKESTIAKVIDSVLTLDYPKKEIIVVNDGSTDKTLEICKKYEREGKIKLISYQKNRGKAFALNKGIKASSFDIIVTVDADSFPKKNSLKKLMKYFVDPEVGAVAGTVKVLNKNKFLTLAQGLEYLHQGFQRVCQGFLDAIMVAPGPLTAYRKEALIKTGYFDNDTSVEDFDMTIKIHKAGYKVMSERKAEVLTLAPESLDRWWKQRVRWSRGGLQILRKHFDVFSNQNTRKLAYFSFPLHVFWLFFPFVLFPSFLLITSPRILSSFQRLAENFPVFISNILSTPIDFSKMKISLFFASFQETIINFLDLNRFNLVIILGYISVLLFFTFSGFSFKVLDEKFKPKDLAGIFSIFAYWIFLLVVGIYGFFVELFKKKKSW